MQYMKTSSAKTGVILIELHCLEKWNALNHETFKDIAGYLTKPTKIIKTVFKYF